MAGSVRKLLGLLPRSAQALRATEEALFAERERAQVTLDAIGDAVISTDFRGHVIFLNAAAERMSAWRQDQARGKPIDEIFRLLNEGTRDAIACPVTRAIIENRTVRIEEPCVLSRPGKDEIPVETSASPIHDRQGGVIGAVAVGRDVTAARHLSNKLARLALHDVLTGLPNRTLFADRLQQSVARAERSGHFLAVLFIDLDRFKPVNDVHGHAIGDLLLQAAARRLQSCLRATDTAGRIGGDEFVVLLADVVADGDVKLCAGKILAAFDQPFEIDGKSLRVSASVGMAMFPADAKQPDELMRLADIGMYAAKSAGRNQFRRFTPDMHSTERHPS
jgi:diguanylate cyclase (GGDEF)-like protein/PAS domain S-box-containing protein